MGDEFEGQLRSVRNELDNLCCLRNKERDKADDAISKYQQALCSHCSHLIGWDSELMLGECPEQESCRFGSNFVAK